MKVLFIYPNARGYGRIPLGISVLMTILENKGHEIDLFDTTFILQAENIDTSVREKAKLALPTETDFLYDSHTEAEVDQMMLDKVISFSPDLVAITILEDNYEYADRLLKVVKNHNKKITVLAGGTTPTIVPNIILNNPNIDYLIKGEGEEPIEEFCELMEMGKPLTDIGNLWYTNKNGMHNNPIRPFTNMDSLPVQNLDLWDEKHYVKPYDGMVHKAGYFELSRGCMLKCTYCVNEQYQRVLEDSGKYFRRKSIKNGINEIKLLKDKYNYDLIFFCDDNFLYMNPKEWKSLLRNGKAKLIFRSG